MGKTRYTNLFLLLALVVTFSFLEPPAVWAEKIGVLFFAGGMEDTASINTRVGYTRHLWAVWPAGFLAGGPFDGGTCYTMVHYANHVEADYCGVAEGTPVDAFCNDLTTDILTYPVHSINDHITDGTYFTQCSSLGFPAVLLAANTTIDPVTLAEIEGPHIDDPAGSGIGIADFLEFGVFDNMEVFHHLPNESQPHREQALKFWYGNDFPAAYGYATDTPELLNIKDAIQTAMPEHTFVFRNGWTAVEKNVDVYGNPVTPLWNSTETAIDELVNVDQVDRIIVMSGSPGETNLTSFGPCWKDKNGDGVSVIPGKTFRECVEDLTDGFGPATQADLDEYVANKPWKKHEVQLPEIQALIEAADPSMPYTFARSVGSFTGFDQATLDLLNYIVAKYSIPQTANLKVILVPHGLSGGYLDAFECDLYFPAVDQTANRIITKIQSELSWSGTLEVTYGHNEWSEAEHDPPSPAKPFGDRWSFGEQIDIAMNGTYVNELGQMVDNGTGNFDYIIGLPISFVTDSTDSLTHFRTHALGNEIYEIVKGAPMYERDHDDADGSHFDAAEGDYDAENFTVKTYDGTGWPSLTGCLEDTIEGCHEHHSDDRLAWCAANPTECDGRLFYRGTAASPTTVIIPGTILSLNGNTAARSSLLGAAVAAITEAVQDPNVGGSFDPICIADATDLLQGPLLGTSLSDISQDQNDPTPVTLGLGDAIIWKNKKSPVQVFISFRLAVGCGVWGTEVELLDPANRFNYWSFYPTDGLDPDVTYEFRIRLQDGASGPEAIYDGYFIRPALP